MDLVGGAVSDLTAATLAGTLRAVVREGWGDTLPTRFAVIGMGRFGGHELGYGSDADVLFVHEPRDGVDEREASEAANKVVAEMRRLLQVPSADPPLLVDADLRPEGKSGPLVRTLGSYEAYYRRWALVWERHALLRAEPVAGDVDLGRRFVELIDPLRYPAGGLDEDAVREIRRLKARMESERMPRGADPKLHAKLGPGGLSDVEWTVQLLQLRHGAAEVPGLRTTRTREALAAAREAGLMSEEDACTLDEAWVLATRVRNAVMLVRGRAGTPSPPCPGNWPPSAATWATDPATPATCSTPTVVRAAAPGAWWRSCSTAARRRGARASGLFLQRDVFGRRRRGRFRDAPGSAEGAGRTRRARRRSRRPGTARRPPRPARSGWRWRRSPPA